MLVFHSVPWFCEKMLRRNNQKCEYLCNPAPRVLRKITSLEAHFVNDIATLALRIILSILGIALVILAVLILLKGLGVLPRIPDYVAWALVLFAVGAGIMGGLRSTSRK